MFIELPKELCFEWRIFFKILLKMKITTYTVMNGILFKQIFIMKVIFLLFTLIWNKFGITYPQNIKYQE